MKRYTHTILLALLLLVALVMPGLAQEDQTHTVAYDGISFSFADALATNVNIINYPGDPVESAGPGFSDAAKLQFTLYQTGQPMESIFDTGGVRVYRMADLAQYDFLMAQVEKLQELMAEQADLSQYATGIERPELGGLPYVPVLTHGQVLTARANYVTTDVLEGISYVSVVRADFGPLLSTDFMYTFQGISTDGQYYVTVTFMLKTDLFPESLAAIDYNIEVFQNEWPAYLAESIERVNTASADDFTPSLDLVDALVNSIQLGS